MRFANIAGRAHLHLGEDRYVGDLAADEVLIKAPMVGVYYASPKPNNSHSSGRAKSWASAVCSRTPRPTQVLCL